MAHEHAENVVNPFISIQVISSYVSLSTRKSKIFLNKAAELKNKQTLYD